MNPFAAHEVQGVSRRFFEALPIAALGSSLLWIAIAEVFLKLVG